MSEQRGRKREAARRRGSAKKKGRALLIVYGVVLLCVLAGAVLLCIFVFFRVNEVKVLGSAIYSSDEIAAELGFKKGDNLVFTDTKDAAALLEAKFPYIEKAEINKKIPSTIEVNITEAQVYYSFVYGEQYIYVSRNGKMLEAQDEPFGGSMVVKGVDVKENNGKIEFTDISKAAIFQDITAVFLEKDNIGITEINLESIHKIYAVYDGRVKMIFGSAADLIDKLNFGLQIAGSIGPDEKGSMNLSYVKDMNTAYFMPDVSSGSEDNGSSEENHEEGAGNNADSGGADGEGGSQAPEGADGGEESGDPSEEGSQENEEGASASEGGAVRGDDIPDV